LVGIGNVSFAQLFLVSARKIYALSQHTYTYMNTHPANQLTQLPANWIEDIPFDVHPGFTSHHEGDFTATQALNPVSDGWMVLAMCLLFHLDEQTISRLSKG